MIAKLKDNNKVIDIKEWIKNNPKKVYIFSWGTIIISIIINIMIDIYYPNKNTNSVFNIPSLFEESDKKIIEQKGFQIEKEKILREVEILKRKKEKIGLDKNDSLRIEYLYNKYKKIGNGTGK